MIVKTIQREAVFRTPRRGASGPRSAPATSAQNTRDRLSSLTRTACCAMLLTLLAVCGYMGASGTEAAQTVSVPVVRQTLSQEQVSASSLEEIRARLKAEREAELALLDSVLADPSATASTKDSALLQKTQIAARMESEAQAVATLEMMGFSDVAAVCGAQMMTIITPPEQVQQEQDRARMIDAVCTQTGMGAESVKIILTKK